MKVVLTRSLFWDASPQKVSKNLKIVCGEVTLTKTDLVTPCTFSPLEINYVDKKLENHRNQRLHFLQLKLGALVVLHLHISWKLWIKTFPICVREPAHELFKGKRQKKICHPAVHYNGAKAQSCVVQKFCAKGGQSLMSLPCTMEKTFFCISNVIISQSMWLTFLKLFAHILPVV